MTERAQSWRNAFYAGTFFGLAFGIYTAASSGWLPPQTMTDTAHLVTTTLVSGSVFGVLLGLFMNSPIVPQAEDIPLMPGETLEYSGPANHFLNLEGRGGRLAVTNSHLVFKPHAVNVQRSDLRIARADIVGVAPVRTFGVVPNGIAVTLKCGKVEKFVVNNRNTWITKIGV